jgi:excisionase family DNA binding protein
MGEAARYLTDQGVADYLSISRSLVRKMVERRELPEPISITERLKRWDREAIDAHLAGQRSSEHAPQRVGNSADDIAERAANDLAQRRAARRQASGRR